MLIRLICTILLVLGVAGTAAPSTAQQQAIEVPATSRWQHARSGIIIPTRIGNLTRQSIAENIPGEVDVTIQFADETTRLTVYLFRPQQNDVGLWFDRAEQVMMANTALSPIAPASDGPTAFALPISPTASALRRIYNTGGDWRSTAIAIAPSGRWLLKLRVTSSALDDVGLEALVERAFASIRLPADAAASPPARIVLPCASPVQWRRARERAPDLADSLLASMGLIVTNSVMRSEADTPDGEPARPFGLALPDLCRDSANLGANAAYRSPSNEESYWVVLGDSGAYAIIAPPVLGDRAGDRSLTVATPTNTLIFGKYNRAPSPEQVVETVMRTGPSAATGFDPEVEAARQPAATPAPPAP